MTGTLINAPVITTKARTSKSKVNQPSIRVYLFFSDPTLLSVNRARYIPLGTTSVSRSAPKNTPYAARGALTTVVPLTTKFNTPL